MGSLRYWWRHPQMASLIQMYRGISLREQQLIRLTLAVVIVALIYWLGVMPLWEKLQKTHQQQIQVQQEQAKLQAQLQALHDSKLHDPDQAVRAELKNLEAQQELLDERINALTQALVSPAQMTELLADILAQNQNLKTRSLQTLPAQRVDLGDGYDDVELFRHSLQLTMDVTFPALVDYLSQLDQLPWLLGWESLEFNIEEYPRGEVVIRVSTLSRRQEVLGGE